MAYEGGYTSAVSSAATRDQQGASTAALRQRLAEEAAAFQQEQQDRAEDKKLGMGALKAFALMQIATPPNAPDAPQGPQAPPPGQGSQPMIPPPPQAVGGMPPVSPQMMAMMAQRQPQPAPQGPPQPQPGQMPPPPGGGMPQQGVPAPQGQAPAPPQPQGWQPSPAASPALGGGAPAASQRPPQMPGAIPPPPGAGMPQAQSGGSLGAPAQPGVLPPQWLSVPKAIEALDKAGIPPDQQYKTLAKMMPMIDKQNKQALDDLGFQVKASHALNETLTRLLNERKAEEKATEDKRHHLAQEGQGQQKIDIHVGDAAKTAGKFGGENGELMAALAERGVSLPAGFRSKEQQIAMLDGLRKRNPGMTADQIADKVESGQIDLNAARAESRTAGGIAGKVAYAEKEIEQIAPLVREASAKVPREKFVPWNKLKQYTDTQLSDPNLKELHSYLNTLSNAYDMLAARGGTDKDKRAENRKLFDTADSPQALERAIVAIEKEAKASGVAGRASMKSHVGDDSAIPSGWSVKER